MALNDIKISQLSPILDDLLTENAEFIISLSGSSFKLKLSQIGTFIAVVLEDLPPIAESTIDGNSLILIRNSVETGQTKLSNIVPYISDNITRPTYDFELEESVLNVGVAFVNIVSLSTSDRPPGTYEIKVAAGWTFRSTTDSVEFQIIGSISTGVFDIESKDIDNVHSEVWLTPFVHPGGTFTATLQARKTGGTAELDFTKASVILDCKLLA